MNAKQKELQKWLRRYGNEAVKAHSRVFVENVYETHSEGDVIELKKHESADHQVHTFQF